MARFPTAVALPNFQMLERNSHLRYRSFMECVGGTKPLTKAIQEVSTEPGSCSELAKGLCDTEECNCNPTLSGDSVYELGLKMKILN